MIFVRIFVLTKTKTIIMKKNKFKKPVITYDPIIQKKQPLWMHSVQTYRTSRTTLGEVLILVAIFAALVFTWSILG